ncbi:PREDICTED: protein unc-93 homolog A [Ceratosolen solmsi marchali]|uniref:Protein unc-93 homolog A n=1 Tax=Ceratosolen solmsi marchali TaxID=326594 RepID=A0AAJ6YGF8_9HYME|nr:PREDICTED: protein unc-93 homolog A [Ceratosolen solmsi marchali]
MGSLPNLHELSREKLSSPVHRPAPVGDFGPVRLPPQPPPLAYTHKRARSSGHHHHTTQLWDNDVMLEHMATYSPISCRSARTSALSWRRRDSMSSSAGASSVRRLIATVRAAPSGPRPPKKAVLRHCAAVLLGHASWSAATLPMFPLQAGLGVFEPQLGPVLLALLFAAATLASCFAPIITQKLGTNLVISIGHLITVLFVGVHLYPKWYILLPSYALLGVWMSPSFLARTAHVNISATSLGLVCSDPEDPDETRRDCILRRLSRGIKLAEDIGLAFGCFVASLLIKITETSSPGGMREGEIEDICGAEYCPEERYLFNETLLLPTMAANTSRMVVTVWLGLAVLAFSISCAFLDGRMKEPQGVHDRLSSEAILKSVKCAFQDPKMQLATPLTLFIGLEQGFIFADFTEAYVVCALGGAGAVTLSFLNLGLLQALAGATLSMLMRHIKRYFVIAVGFAFHACLLLVLVTWRPAGDDPALFHVISAAWGVCNAIWEVLIYTLLLGLHPGAWQGPVAVSLFWRWLGLSLALGLHGLVCTRVRVLGLAAMLLLSVLPYTWLEMRLARRGKCLAPL